MAKAKKQEQKKKRGGQHKAVRKDKGILIRVTEAQKALLAEAADDAALALSAWILSVALREAKRSKKENES